MEEGNKILKENYNCWRIRNARRASFLIDAANYFESLVSAVNQAKKTIYIAGWDIDSRIRLLRSDKQDSTPVTLAELLNTKVKSTSGLQAYILCWDFSMIFAAEREWLPIFRLSWKTHRRVHFQFDGEHPIGASQHQKIVVVDDSLAFCGGIDLTKQRWDTPEHRPKDHRRVDPTGKPYGPFHDVQMLVDAQAAKALGDLFRDRWRLATGEELEPVEAEGVRPWPHGVSPDLTDVQVAVSRTFPPYKGRKEVREAEALYKDSIEAARKHIYIENQYLTSVVVAEALANSLHQKRGPEIVIVIPHDKGGWLERSTMNAIRSTVLKRLSEVDHHKRLRVMYPVCEDREESVMVHAKVMIVDDRLVRVGSSNLSNRSMGLDSECDLAVEADAHRVEIAVANLRSRLLGEHLGTTRAEVSEVMREKGSLIQTIESLQSPGRTLKAHEIPDKFPLDVLTVVPDTTLLDPEQPVAIDQMIDHFVQNEESPNRKHQLAKVLIIVVMMLGLSAAWRWTALSEYMDLEKISAWAYSVNENAMSPLFVLLAYILGGLVMFPVTLMVGATAVIFSPLPGALYAIAGCLLSSTVTYGIGSRLGKDMIRKMAGRKLNRLSRRIAKQGILTVAIVRNLPIAPFTVINLVAGASRISFKDFLLGTLVGMTPGILAVTIFADRLICAIKAPDWGNIVLVAGLGVVLALGGWRLRKRLSGEGGKH